jgi:hypothetical protein
VVLGLSLVRLGAVIILEVLNFHGVAHHSPGAHPLGENDFFLLFPHPVLGVSSLGLNLGISFLEIPHFPLGETPSGEFLVLGVVVLLEVPPSLGELTLQRPLNILAIQI